jgi:multicomponent Na+:H+ antiporter subunit A
MLRDLVLLSPLIFPSLAVLLVVLAGAVRPAWTARIAIASAVAAFIATLGVWWSGGGAVAFPWAPTWNLSLTFALDGLAALYALLATGIGTVVLVYASRYLPLHLEHQGRPAAEATRFYAFLLVFMAAMVGLVMAEDLLLIFVFWDLTAVASYYLIGYDRARAEARDAALKELLVTGITSIFVLIGAVLLSVDYGTFSLPVLEELARPDTRMTVATGLIALGAIAKSAQVPFHFWLPRAMAAPTPVSAYLHSAAMVAAGIFLLERIYPLLRLSGTLLDILLVIGFLSIAVGGVLALTHDVLKQVLAYSTISQYGYMVAMLGLGGEAGVIGTSFYVAAHALLKCALFLTAGAVTEATERTRLSHLGGLLRHMPLLAAASGVAAAGLAGLPLTAGFFKDDLFFRAALMRGTPFLVAAVLGAALTFAYIFRFWGGIFLGPARSGARAIPALLVWPVAVLGALVVLFGIVPGPLSDLVMHGATSVVGAIVPVTLAYHLENRPENMAVLAVYAIGGLLLLVRPVWQGAASEASRVGERIGPERWYRVGLEHLNRFSRRLVVVEQGSLRLRVATVLIPATILLGIAFLVSPKRGHYTVAAIGGNDLVLVLFLAISATAAFVATIPRDQLTVVLALSSVGYSLAAVYTFFGAPDVALVAVLIETVLTLLILGVFALVPRAARAREARTRSAPWRSARDRLIGLTAGAGAFVLAWVTLSRPAVESGMAAQHLALARSANARNVVTAILADFRGFDTLGEITVIAIAMLGVLSLLRRSRP